MAHVEASWAAKAFTRRHGGGWEQTPPFLHPSANSASHLSTGSNSNMGEPRPDVQALSTAAFKSGERHAGTGSTRRGAGARLFVDPIEG